MMYNQFKGYVIPSHFEKHDDYLKSETVHYWTVTITLTSGDVEEFYIKARNYSEALEKAEKMVYLAKIKTNKRGFRYIP